LKTLQIELPPEVSKEEARLLLAIKLYELGRLSLGQSAKLAGYSERAFIELLGKYGVPVVAYSSEELREEVEGRKNLLLLTAHVSKGIIYQRLRLKLRGDYNAVSVSGS
jgi:predicted HTH domain antitoxin